MKKKIIIATVYRKEIKNSDNIRLIYITHKRNVLLKKLINIDQEYFICMFHVVKGKAYFRLVAS